jgi:hypothetical protein
MISVNFDESHDLSIEDGESTYFEPVDSEEVTDDNDGDYTCYDFFKFFICKHIIYISVKLKKTEIDTSFRKLTKKSKRGRKPKTKPALLRM